ncbi:MAG TPA: hypothetical protein VGX48_18180 [Pyrinomonadaceae bacterium]|jgi:hypothetical protein|nr:hypothetical protein [Pyrinomonadaceae bacterium]
MPFISRFSRSGRDILFNGKVVKVGGIYASADGKTTTDTLDMPADFGMKLLADNGNNFHRHIMTPYWVYSPPESVQPRNCCFVRTPGGKWDITAYNADYFRRLKMMIDTAANFGIAVQIVLFDRTGLDASAVAPIRRWEHAPWNKANNVNAVLQATDPTGHGGLPEFYAPDPELRRVQELYIRHVVSQTKSWNVFYEIMVEPMWGDSSDVRVRWADWVVGVIRSATGGLNLVFYNDHTGGARGADVNRWKQLALPNYNNFHGVIFHGTPTDYNPNNTAYAFRAEKIFQLSTDAGPSPARDTYQSNLDWCRHAFNNRMMYHAHSKTLDAARGIRDNHPSVIEPEWREPINPDPDPIRLQA